MNALVLSGPVPEKPINTAECRKNLLDEIEDGFNNLEARINLFEAKTNGIYFLFEVIEYGSFNFVTFFSCL